MHIYLTYTYIIIAMLDLVKKNKEKAAKKYVYIQTNFPLLNLPSLNIEPSAFVSTK